MDAAAICTHGLNALDLRTCMKDGTPWNFDLREHRQMAKQMVIDLKPTWLIGSPPCTAYSRLNWNWNFPKMDQARVQEKIAEGRRHLRFVISLYRIQLQHGRHVLHEHPDGAMSWHDEWMAFF